MKRKVGDYEWIQLSMWDFAPKQCVEKFVKSHDGRHTFHYYLRRVTEIASSNRWKSEIVTSDEGVPEDVLKWRASGYRIRSLKGGE
jgi:hypothetical protein